MKRVLKKGTDVTSTSFFSKKLPYLQMPAFAHKPKAYMGPSYQEVLRKRQEHVSTATFTVYKQPVLVAEARKQYIFDHTGSRYLDMNAGFATTGVGHCHPMINAKLHE